MNNPYTTLGITEAEATDEIVQQAWLARLREYPPERDPEMFRQIRRAYETLRTERQRLAYALLSTEPPTLDDLTQQISGVARTPGRPKAATMRACLKTTISGASLGRPTIDLDSH